MLRPIFFAFFVLAGILVEATVAPLPLGLVFVILGSIKGPSFYKVKGWTLMTFLAGLLADILLLRPIGVTGAIYGGVVVLLRMYSHKFETARLTYLLPYTGVIVGLYSSFFYLEWRWQVVVAVLIVIFVRLLTPNQNKIRYGAGWNRSKEILYT